MTNIPAPPEGASARQLAEWAVDTGRISADSEDGLAGILPGYDNPRAVVIAEKPNKYDNSQHTALRPVLRELREVKARLAAKASPAVAARSRVAASTYVSNSLPAAPDALATIYSAATGRPANTVYAAGGRKAPEPFQGSGNLPASTASGMAPAVLAKAPWQARWAIAKAPTTEEASHLLNQSIEMHSAFGDLAGSEWPPSGLDDDAQAYVREYSRFLSGFPADDATFHGF